MRWFDKGADRLGSWPLLSAFALAALLAGCPDSLRLDPGTSGSGSGGKGATGSGGGGMGGGGPCVSNSDCAAPNAVCDTAKSECVQCLEIADCAFQPGTVCSQGKCACPTAGEEFCDTPSRCVDKQTSSSDCGSCGHACFGACTAGKCADAWEPTPMTNAPTARANHVAVWTGTKMIVWGGGAPAGNTNTGGLLDLEAGTWTPTSLANVPSPRAKARAVWTGMQMVVWGGENGGPLNTGGVYNPATNTWTSMTTVGAPSPRYGHAMVWAGAPTSKVLVWGGFDGTNYLNDGAMYDVTTDTWTPIAGAGPVPAARADHTAVWTGSMMIVWGGFGSNGAGGFDYLADGGEFDPAAGGTWTNILQGSGQASARSKQTAVWTGTEMIVWGGNGPGGALLSDGSRYVPQVSWTAMIAEGSPEARQYHTAVWLAPRLLVWGGQNAGGAFLNSGSMFDPSTNKWSVKSMPTAPAGRAFHTTVAAETRMIIWGGQTAVGLTNTGAVFDPTKAN
jgi:hypothetical protein